MIKIRLCHRCQMKYYRDAPNLIQNDWWPIQFCECETLQLKYTTQQLLHHHRYYFFFRLRVRVFFFHIFFSFFFFTHSHLLLWRGLTFLFRFSFVCKTWDESHNICNISFPLCVWMATRSGAIYIRILAIWNTFTPSHNPSVIIMNEEKENERKREW